MTGCGRRADRRVGTEVARWRRRLPGVVFALAVGGWLFSSGAWAAEDPVRVEYPARDSLKPMAEASTDARGCLDPLLWKPAVFTVTLELQSHQPHDAMVFFPSPVTSGDADNDVVTMEWYAARDAGGARVRAPAILVVHESGSNMAVGRLVARALRAEGLHAFLIQLPYYGRRRGTGERPEPSNLVTVMRQGIADVRRGRDAIAVLPGVATPQVALQGTSLGGFVVALAASLDRGFSPVFIMLAGGRLDEMLKNGQQDTARLRRELEQAGFSAGQIRELLWQVEPLRLAHRLDPRATWLYSAEQDTVVPIENAVALARAAGLDATHHVRVPGGHYSAILRLPSIVREVAERTAPSKRVEPDFRSSGS